MGIWRASGLVCIVLPRPRGNHLFAVMLNHDLLDGDRPLANVQLRGGSSSAAGSLWGPVVLKRSIASHALGAMANFDGLLSSH